MTTSVVLARGCQGNVTWHRYRQHQQQHQFITALVRRRTHYGYDRYYVGKMFHSQPASTVSAIHTANASTDPSTATLHTESLSSEDWRLQRRWQKQHPLIKSPPVQLLIVGSSQDKKKWSSFYQLYNTRFFSSTSIDHVDGENRANTDGKKDSKKTSGYQSRSAPKKKLTMRDFFENLDETLKNAASSSSSKMIKNKRQSQINRRRLQNDHHNHQVHQGNKSSNNHDDELIATTSTITKQVDMGSFFQEVNSLMDKKNSDRDSHAQRISNKRETEASRLSSTTKTIPTSTRDDRPSIYDMMRHEFENDSNDVGHDDDDLSLSSKLGPSAYDRESYREYSEILEKNIFVDRRFARRHTSKPLEGDDLASVKEWLLSPEPIVDCNILLDDLKRASEEADSSDSIPISDRLRSALKDQREKFIDQLGWDAKQYKVALTTLQSICRVCAKKATAVPLFVIWPKLNEAGCKMDEDLLHTLLYISSTFLLPNRNWDRISSGKNRSSGSLFDFLDDRTDEHKQKYGEVDRDLDDSQKCEEQGGGDGNPIDITSEFAAFHDILYTPTEQTTSIHVRRLVSEGKTVEAEKILDDTPIGQDLRHRTYLPVFQAYIDERDASSALRVFMKMKQGHHVEIVPETFVQLIACVAENGYFSLGSPPLDGARELGYDDESGPKFFDRLAFELAENTVEITSASAKRIYNAFQIGFGKEDPSKNLKPLSLLENLGVDNNSCAPDELVINRVKIDGSTGKCPKTGAYLRLINLDAGQKQRYRDGLLFLTAARYKERKLTKANNVAEDNLRTFGEWLERRKDDPFTAIIDGPNVAFYMQNFLNGSFNYHQIKFVVDTLEQMGEKVLVVLPNKYTRDSFSIQRLGGNAEHISQKLSTEDRKIRDGLIKDGKMYVVPGGNLDDFYWMYASVSMEESYVPPDNAGGRFPGIRPMLISNDKLRDHRMSLLEPRLFRRWYSNFLVNFTFSAFVGERSSSKEIGFKTADIYSREIQGNVDEAQGMVWHFPVADWPPTDCLCVRIPTGKQLQIR